MEKIKKDFIKKFLTKYYVFGYCCILGFFLQAFFFECALLLPQPFRFISFIVLLVATTLLIRKWLLITSTTYTKYRFYKIGRERLDEGVYNKNYFLEGMYDPCFMIIVKDLLTDYGYKDEYQELKKIKKLRPIPFES